MTAQSRAFETAEPLMRWQAVASIIRNDMHLLGPYALAGAIWMFAMSALFHTGKDFSALMASIGVSGLGLDVYLFALFGIGPPVALTLFVILLAQTNVASDTRHDWLIRPITPLELVASKVVTLFCVIVAPMIVGNFIYMTVKAAPMEEAFVFFLPILTCGVLVLVLSWLVSTPFRAVLALLGVFVLLTVAIALAEAIKRAIGFALGVAGGPPDLTPFPSLDDSWIVSLVAGIGLYVVSGISLWLLLARRKRFSALVVRRLFRGLGIPAERPLRPHRPDRTAACTGGRQTRPDGGVSPSPRSMASDRRGRITRNANGGRDNDANFKA
jgi:hypothetical protein